MKLRGIGDGSDASSGRLLAITAAVWIAIIWAGVYIARTLVAY